MPAWQDEPAGQRNWYLPLGANKETSGVVPVARNPEKKHHGKEEIWAISKRVWSRKEGATVDGGKRKMWAGVCKNYDR